METESTIAEILRRVTEGQETVIDIEVDEHGSRTVKFGNRKLQPGLPELERTESPPRAHTLHTAEAVADYVNRYGSNDTVVLLDATTLTGRVVLRETADKQRETLKFEPQLHPLFREWLPLIGQRTPVSTFAEFAIGHRRQIVSPDGRTVALLFGQMRARKEVTISVGEGKSAINGVMVTTTIQGKPSQEFVEVPDFITVHVPLFVGGEPKDIEIDLTVGESNGTIYVLCSASGVEEAKHQAFDAMCAAIREGITHEAVIVLGAHGSGQWNYLKA
jgi:hypothetical protein